MRWFRFAVLVLILTVLQAGLLDRIALGASNIKPDLLLITLVFFALYGLRPGQRRRRAADLNLSEAIITSFVIGFFADIIGPAMGPQMISFGLFGTLLAHLHRVVTVARMWSQAAVIMVTALLAAMLVQFLTFLKGEPTMSLAVIFATALYSAVLGPFLFLPTAWWMRIKTTRFRRR